MPPRLSVYRWYVIVQSNLSKPAQAGLHPVHVAITALRHKVRGKQSPGGASISQIERRVRGADDGPELASSQSGLLCRVRRCKLVPFPTASSAYANSEWSASLSRDHGRDSRR